MNGHTPHAADQVVTTCPGCQAHIAELVTHEAAWRTAIVLVKMANDVAGRR